MKPFRFTSIRHRLTFWFLIVSILPLIIVSGVQYRLRVQAIEKRAFNKLEAIRELKVNELNDWIDEKLSDLETISQDPEIRLLEDLFYKETLSPAECTILDSVRESLCRFVENYPDYLEISVLDPLTGDIQLSTNPVMEGQNRAGNPYLTEPLKTSGIYIKGIFYSKNLRRMSMTFSKPILCRKHHGAHVVGVVMLRVDLQHSVYQLIEDYSGLGKTGETLLVNRDLRALNRLRWSSLEPLRLTLNGTPERQAIRGNAGITETTDYRGQKVLAAYGFIPKTGWGFVAKQDLREINAPIRSMLLNTLAMMALSVLVVYFVTKFLSKNIASPVLEMTEVSKRIQGGDLHARNHTFFSDELGFLAGSFNRMADSLMQQIENQRDETEIIDAVARAGDLSEFAEQLLRRLMAVSGSHLGGFYLRSKDGERFEYFTSIGLNPEPIMSFEAKHVEGEFGRVLATRQLSHIENIPADTVFTFRTFAGEAVPKATLTIPLVVNDVVQAIICLASLSRYSQKSLDLLSKSWVTGLNTSFSNLLANEETRRLAGELREKNEELRIQAEEMTAQAAKLKQQSDELQKKNVELEIKRFQVEEANRLKSQFLSNMSHELRTPLNSVMALSRLLIMTAKPKLSAEEGNYLEVIERNGRNLLDLINDILDLSKIEAGRMDVVAKTFSPVSVVKMVVERVDPLARAKGLRLEIHFPPDFPRIASDEARVHQILQNIIGNAVKFTESGGVTISGTSDEEKIYIEVADTGIGIPERSLPHIFEEFRQVDGTASRKYEGTGLGLAIASKAAVLLGGNISVESAAGKGSSFTLVLPLTCSGDMAAGQTGLSPSPAAEVQPEEKTVLVVDDDPASVIMLSSYLRREGYHTVVATSGKEALRLAETHHPFAVTLDIVMPEMDGFEVLQALKKNPATQDIPVIIVSISEDRETGFALGATGYVSKPVNHKQLMGEIHKVGRPDHRALADYTVMIVDDNELDRTEIDRMVREHGMKTAVAQDGDSCLALLARRIPDILLLDLLMPGMDGFSVLDHVRNKLVLKDLPVIIVTAKDLSREDRRRLNGQVAAVLEKRSTSQTGLLEELKRCLLGIERREVHRSEDPLPFVPDHPVAGRAGNSTVRPAILVVEDNPDNMITLKAVLQDRYEICEASDGEEGLRLARKIHPDLILLDMGLPGMDGLKVVRTIRENEALCDIPVIALTALAMKGDREKILSAGCDEYVSKPFEPEALMGVVARQLGKGKCKQLTAAFSAERGKYGNDSGH